MLHHHFILTNYRRDKSERPSRSQPKIKIGIFKLPWPIETIGCGEPGLPRPDGILVWIFEINRDEAGKVVEIEKCRDISTYPNLSWPFTTYLSFYRLIPYFPSTNLGYYFQKSRQYQLSQNSKNREKLRKSRNVETLPKFLNLSRLVSISLGYNSDALDPTRFFTMSSRSWFHPDGRDKNAPRSRSRTDWSWFLSGFDHSRDILPILDCNPPKTC